MTLSPHPLPETLEDLRRLLDGTGSAPDSPKLAARSRQALAAMLDDPGLAAMASITELAERADVNASTLSRLSRRLGFSGFAALQELFRREFKDGGQHFYSDRLIEARGHDQPDLLHRVGRQESGNIAAMMDGVASADFDRAASLLTEARRVRIHGLRQFHALGYFMAYALGMIRGDVATLDAGPQGLADALSPLQPGDLLVVASSFPYTPGVVTAAQTARQLGLDVLALTDSIASPLTEYASSSFCVPNRSDFYSNGMAAFFVLVEALLAEVASRLGDSAIAALQRREGLIRALAPLA